MAYPPLSLGSPGSFRLREGKLETLLQISDQLMIWASLVVVLRLYAPEVPWTMRDSAAAMLAGMLYCYGGHARNLYLQSGVSRSKLTELQSIVSNWLYVVAPLLVIGFMTKTLGGFSRVTIISWFVLAPVALWLSRMVYRWVASNVGGPRLVAAVGAYRVTLEMAEHIACTPELGLRFVGTYDDRHVERHALIEGRSWQLRGSIEDLVAAAKSGHVDVVYISLPLRAERRISEVIRTLQDTTVSVYLAFDFSAVCVSGARPLHHVGMVPLLSVSRPQVPARDGFRSGPVDAWRRLTGQRKKTETSAHATATARSRSGQDSFGAHT